MSMHLHLLGTPRLERDGHSETLPLNKPSSLVFYLACRGGWVSRSELAFLYRPDAADTEALNYLRKLVFRARQFPWAAGLTSQDTRLCWEVDNDIARFRAAISAQRWAEALEAYGGTLLEGLYLADAPGYEAWLELERESLESAWHQAASVHAAALEEAGALDEAAHWFKRILARDPLDEDNLQAYLRVLHSDGKRHRALEAYEAFKRVLKEELGAEPLETTQALADSIQRDASTRPAPGAPPPLAPRHRLPAQTTRFVGREQELQQLARCLARPDCRLITLLGLGGTGKTRLALESAAQHEATFPGGVYFVPLASVSTAALLPQSIASTLGVTLRGGQAPERELADALADKALLLLLDNFEHLQGGVPLLETLLEAAPGLKLLVTSRTALELPGEWLVDVGGLRYPPPDTAEPLERFEAVELFISRAERLSAGFTATGTTLEAIASLCRKVEGMPLALELAATWTRSLSVPELLKRLGRRFELSASKDAGLPERHRNLRAVLDHTWHNLGSEEQAVLTSLSRFLGGFSVEAAEAVAGAHLGLLLRFINHALVRRSGEGRYDMHELVRHYLSERLSDEAKRRTLEALCDFFAVFLSERERQLREGDEKGALGELELEMDNLRLAWRYASDEGRLTPLQQMAECYHFLLDTKGWYQEGAAAFYAALETAARRLKAPAQRETLGILAARAGYFEFRLGHFDEAGRLLEASLDSLAGGAPAAEGFALHYLGVLAFLAGDNHGAQRYYHQALDRLENAHDAWALSRTHNNLGVVADTLGHYDEALRWYCLALERSKEVGHTRGVASALVNLGVTYETLGRLDEAQTHYQDSLEAYREVGDTRGEAASLTNLGHLAERQKAYPQAQTYYEASVDLKRALGDPVVTAVSLTNLGDVRLALGDKQGALENFAEALALTRKANALPYALRVIWSYAKLHAEQADWPCALYLASFLTQRAESEAWVQEEAADALEAWGSKLCEEQRADAAKRGQNASFESLFASLKPSA